MTNRSISEFPPVRYSAAPLLSALSLRSSAYSAPLRYLFLSHCLSPLPGDSLFFSAPSSSNRRFSAKNAKNTNITFRLSIILLNNVGAPTYFSRDRNTNNRHFIDPNKGFSPHSGLLFSPKSNHSRTYAKTGGWGTLFELSTFNFEPFCSPNSFVASRHNNWMLTDLSNDTVGAPTFFSRHAPTLHLLPLFLNLKLKTYNLELHHPPEVP
jgi:hypothetical protein